MQEKRRRSNPVAFIAIGVCYMGAGVALGAALRETSGFVIGVSLVGIGVVFLVLGVVRKRKMDKGEPGGQQ
jgi:uncharacterized membrane protein YidH (DUF202 family)